MREVRNERLNLHVSARLKAALRQLVDEDPRRFRSLSDYAVFLLEEAVARGLPAKEVVRRQRAAARAAERKLG